MNDRIEKLWPHLGNMTPDEARDRIRAIRKDRRVAKLRPGAKKKAAKAANTSARAVTSVSKMSAELREALLRELGGGEVD